MTVPQNEDIFPTKLGPEYVGFDHIQWYVGNPKQAASYWITRMGFRPIAYRGPETGSPYIVSYVVANGGATFVLTGPVCGPPCDGSEDGLLRQASDIERVTLAQIHEHLTIHGDGVKDVAFRIAGDIEAVWKRAVGNGARVIAEPRTVAVDGHGPILSATVGTYGDTVHSLVNRERYSADAPFLPGYRVIDSEDPISQLLPPIDLLEIDHCVGNQSWGGVDSIVQ
jgi:4-hydroxyphenylpyruvate dioxygenase